MPPEARLEGEDMTTPFHLWDLPCATGPFKADDKIDTNTGELGIGELGTPHTSFADPRQPASGSRDRKSV